MKGSPWEKARLLRSLAVLYKCGVPLERSLDLLARQFTHEFAGLHTARRRLCEGHSLSGALKDLFPARMRAMLRMGEESGTLDTVLATLADEEEARSGQDQRLRSALAYPFFLLVLTVAVLLVAGPAVLRGTTDFLASYGQEAGPGLGLLRVLSHPVTWLAGLGAGVWVYRWLGRHPEVWLRVKLLDRLWMARAVARFSRSLAGALRSGVNLLPALGLTREACGHPRLRREIGRWMEELRQGRDLRGSVLRSQGLPPSFVSTLACGLDTGCLDRLLPSLAWLYDQEVDSATESLAAAAVPMVMLTMGGLVTVVIFTLTGPLVKLMATL